MCLTRYTAIRVHQPIGEFYLTAMPADVLLRVAFSSPHKRHAVEVDGSVEDVGNQRTIISKRISSISQYVMTQDATLPGTIILAANCTPDGNIIDPDFEDEQLAALRWRVEKTEKAPGEVVELVIPSVTTKLAAIVDGQHRLGGFKNVPTVARNFVLPCAVFLDMPTPTQASVFATINFNQKPVSKSQTYELFGYNLDEERETSWSPEKLAVFFSRKLNADDASPFKNHIKIAAIDDTVLRDVAKAAQREWSVSTATIVESVLLLITKNAQRDRDLLHRYDVDERDRYVLREELTADSSARNAPVFRDVYLSGKNDHVIYQTVLNYFIAVDEVFWKTNAGRCLRKTAGIQALFRVLPEILRDGVLMRKDLRKATFAAYLVRAARVDFSAQIFQESSGKGRTQIMDALLVAMGLKDVSEVKNEKLREHLRGLL